jgi:hypothetical protein
VDSNVWTCKLGDKFEGQSRRAGCEGHIDLEMAPDYQARDNAHKPFGSGLSPAGVTTYSDIRVVSRWTSSSPMLRLMLGEPITAVFYSWYMDPSEKKPAPRVIWTVYECIVHNVIEGELDVRPDVFDLHWTKLHIETKKQDPKTGALGAGVLNIINRYEGTVESGG